MRGTLTTYVETYQYTWRPPDERDNLKEIDDTEDEMDHYRNLDLEEQNWEDTIKIRDLEQKKN